MWTTNSDVAASHSEKAGSPLALRRSLTLTHAVLYGLGVTIGAGIYVLIAVAAGRAGFHAPIAFMVTAILVGLTGVSLAELGVRMPVAAGEAAFARAAFRSDRAAVAVGLLVIAMALVAASTISVGAAGYIAVFLALPDYILIAAVVFAMGIVAARGIAASVTVAGIMTLIEVGGLTIVIVAGFYSEPDLVRRTPEVLPLTLDPEVWTGIVTASMLAVFAFIGFEGLVNIAEELKEPTRTMPWAILLTLAITTALYVMVMWVALVALGVERLAASKAPLALVFEHLTGASPRTMSAIAVVATLNGIVVNMIMASRVVYGLARQGHLPAVLARISPGTQTPVVATALCVAIVLAFALALPIADLADLSAYLTLVMFAIVNISLIRIKQSETAPPQGLFICPLWVPVAGAVSCAVFLLADLAILLWPDV
jgi:amino acid transporter